MTVSRGDSERAPLRRARTRFDYLIAARFGSARIPQPLMRIWRNNADDLSGECRGVAIGALNDDSTKFRVRDLVFGFWTSVLCYAAALFIASALILKAVIGEHHGPEGWRLLILAPSLFLTFVSVGVIAASLFRGLKVIRTGKAKENYHGTGQHFAFLDFWISLLVSIALVFVISWVNW